MKLAILGALIVVGGVAVAADLKGKSGGGNRAAMSKPAMSRPAPASKPAMSKPAVSKPAVSKPAAVQRPSGGMPSVSRPSAPTNRPGMSKPSVERPDFSKPAQRPEFNRPSVERPNPGAGLNRPVNERPKPSIKLPALDRPNFGGGFNRPDVSRPEVNRPTTLPGKPNLRPETKPAPRPGNGLGGNGFIPMPGDHTRPNRPGNNVDPGFSKPVRPTRPGNNGDPGFTRPTVPPRPDGNRPGGGNNGWRPERPDGRPGRPSGGDTYINTGTINVGSNNHHYFNSIQGGSQTWVNNRQNFWNDWSGQRSERLDDFWDHRSDRWDRISHYRNDRWDSYRERRQDWLDWRKDVWDFRMDRADEIRDFARDSHCQWFTPNWFVGCRWWPGAAIRVNINPWWWWRPVVWPTYRVIYQGAPPPPVTDDYGTDIVIRDEEVYVERQKTVPASQYRAEAIALATPVVAVPPPVPASEDDANLIPLGVWALVQQEEGDAVMFYQLTATREGLITGAYSNVLTGDSQPVSGSIDKQTQRLAFRMGASSNVAIEANLNGMTKDQIAVFVHFGTGKTQEWLLVRMPNPDMPTAPQALPAPVQ